MSGADSAVLNFVDVMQAPDDATKYVDQVQVY